MKSLCKVVMLPTEEKANKNDIVTYEDYKCCTYITILKDISCYTGYHTKQHIHILSDDKIEVGDWFIWMNNKQICCLDELLIKDIEKINTHLKNGDIYKIIATTDSSLTKEYGFETLNPNTNEEIKVMQTGKGSIPRIHDNFLKEYCEKGGIHEVMVEYERHCDTTRTCHNPKGNYPCDTCYDQAKPKVNTDNTISIYPIKDNWNREEVKSFAFKIAVEFAKGDIRPGYGDDLEKLIEEKLDGFCLS